jgi:hypothetical protein
MADHRTVRSLIRTGCIFLLILILLIGCIPSPTIIPSAIEIKRNSLTPLFNTATETINPSNTMVPSKTQTLTSSLTWTPIQQLSSPDAYIQNQQWLTGSSACTMPCWAGITLETTPWEEARRILQSSMVLYTPHFNLQCSFGQCNIQEFRDRSALSQGGRIHGYIYSGENDLISMIKLQVAESELSAPLDRFFLNYDEPSKIYLNITKNFMPPIKVFADLTLTFPNHSFILHYTWKAKQVGNNFIACQSDSDSFAIYIVSSANSWSDEFIRKLVNSPSNADLISLKSLEEVTDLTVNEFYERFKVASVGKCFESPSANWP